MDRFRAVQVGIQKEPRCAVEEMSWGNVLRASAAAREVQKRMEAGDLLGSQRAGFAKGKLISGTKPPKAGEGHSHTAKPVMLEPRAQAPLEQPPDADSLGLIEHL